MTFISYAQNNEDVLLWRALGHVDPKDGFYIDVGANDPVEHSVTRAFYDAGWRGISIEPLPAFHKAFLEQRPRDVNLAIAAGSSDGTLTLYDVPDVRGWASLEPSVAELHRSEGHEVVELAVPVRTLASVCAEYVDGPIHFLKVDVEGYEGDVLRGMDFARFRPWVLVVEATVPGSRETRHEDWDALVTGHGYRYAWFDGLNRYYVADEHAELLAHFGIQPNVFDDYISHHLDKAWDANRAARVALAQAEEDTARALREAQAQAEQALLASQRKADALVRERDERIAAGEAALAEAEALAAVLEHEKRAAQADVARLTAELEAARVDGHLLTEWANDLEARLLATLSSTSWKVTLPLRWAGGVVASMRRPGIVRRALTRVTGDERVRRTLLPLLMRHPGVRRRVTSTLQVIKQVSGPEPTAPLPAVVIDIPEEQRGLPASVRAVLADLQRARKHTGN